jgi:uncharacterized nucleotidyltransferase DUF6036
MTRAELAHILRAASTITNDSEILVIGSQAILASFGEYMLPNDVTRSVEADVAFFNDADAAKADLVDGAIGEGSTFHESFGVYGQGVTIDTPTLPAGWRERLVSFDRDDAAPAAAQCLDPHDLVVSKLYAGREKDYEFTAALIRCELIDPAETFTRIELLEQPEAVRRRVRDRLKSLQRAARDSGPDEVPLV